MRELRVLSGVVHVGVTLRDFQGVLTGVPQYSGGMGPLMDDPDAPFPGLAGA